MPGDIRFCPMVRRTDTLRDFETADLPQRCRHVVSGYSPAILKRALGSLYTKETKSSFEIEHINPSSTRTQRFATLLQMAEQDDFCRKTQLIEVQNRIVDDRFRDSDYRLSQSYVGDTVAWQKERIHFACPKPEDLADLMDGLITAHERMNTGGVPAVIQAAAISYGFVFLHPFEDGNGRIHRFLIHNILARRGFTPEGVMFPVSASMLKNPADYDKTKKAIQEIVDMPDRQIDLFIRFCLQNNGRLSERKRNSHFDTLSNEEIAQMEQAVQSAYGNTTSSAESGTPLQ